jgi:hypothetical protein
LLKDRLLKTKKLMIRQTTKKKRKHNACRLKLKQKLVVVKVAAAAVVKAVAAVIVVDMAVAVVIVVVAAVAVDLVVAVAADLVVVTVDLAVAEDSSGRSERSLMIMGQASEQPLNIRCAAPSRSFSEARSHSCALGSHLNRINKMKMLHRYMI